MIFEKLDPIYQGTIMTWYLLIALTFGFAFFCCVRHKRNILLFFFSGSMFWVAYLSLQSMNLEDDIIKNFPYLVHFSKLNYNYSLTFGMIITVIAACLLLEDKYWTTHNITPMSIKESTDILPTGLCFYMENNMTVLVNHTMERISQILFGRSLLSGKRFWDDIIAGNLLPDVTRYEYLGSTIIRTCDGTVWMFDRKPIKLDIGDAYQITAVDVSDLYEYIKHVREDTFRLRKLNHRLRRYGDRVDQVVRTEENLAARVRIHNDMGKVLLAVKAYIQKTPGITKEQLLNMWKMNLELMHGNASVSAEVQNPFDSLKNAADFLGITIELKGEISKLENTSRLFYAASREALTNSVRHGKATVLTIECKELKDSYIITYTNNGKDPDDTVTEGSGLGNLRKMLENADCSMKIEISPRFKLTVELIKGSEDYIDD